MKYGKNFQDIISSLNEYWKKQGCILVQPYDMEKGAGTFNPATVLGALTKTPRPGQYTGNLFKFPKGHRPGPQRARRALY